MGEGLFACVEASLSFCIALLRVIYSALLGLGDTGLDSTGVGHEGLIFFSFVDSFHWYCLPHIS